MDELPVTRVHLESLTTGDLIKMADNFGIDIPPDLDRIFIIEELLEITSTDGALEDVAGMPADSSAVPSISAEADMADSGLVESVLLPKQYNITFIEVIIRDPFWAFVFWEIKTQDKEQFEKDQDFEGYYLKVSPVTQPSLAAPAVTVSGPAKTEAEGVFTIPVSQDDTAWYLGLSPAGQTNSHQKYKVELCAGTKEDEMILAVSNTFKMLSPHELPAGLEVRSFAAENPVVMLSGYDDFRVVRNNERLPRTKRSGLAGSV